MPRITQLLAEAFRARGAEVATEDWGGTRSSTLGNLLDRLRQVAGIRSSLSARPADVLYVQTSLEPRSVATDLLLILLLSGRRPPTVLQFHGGDAHRLGRPGTRVFTACTRLLFSRVRAALVLSSEERELIAASAPQVRCEVVVNPFVPPAQLPAAPVRSTDGSVRLLFVGRLVAAKGPLVAIEALRELRSSRACRLTIVGGGPAADEIRARAAEPELAERVSVLGRLDHARLTELYATSDIFVLPTDWPEGFPTVLSEAMAAGLPIVTTPTRGIADLLEDGRHALLVPPRDARAVARAIERLLDDEEPALAMSQANREKIREFAPEQVAGPYLEVFGALAER